MNYIRSIGNMMPMKAVSTSLEPAKGSLNRLSNPLQAYSVRSLEKIHIQPNQSLMVQTGAMKAYTDETVKMSTGVHSTWMQTMSRFFGGENIVMNKFSASDKGGWVSLESMIPGQIIEYELKPGEKITFTRGAFIAGDPNVQISLSTSGMSGFFSSMGFFTTTAQTNDGKSGRVFLKSTQGPVEKEEISPETGSITVDNNQIIGYSGNLKTELVLPGRSLGSFVFGNEGIAVKFSGTGTVYLGSISRNAESAEALNITLSGIAIVVGLIAIAAFENFDSKKATSS